VPDTRGPSATECATRDENDLLGKLGVRLDQPVVEIHPRHCGHHQVAQDEIEISVQLENLTASLTRGGFDHFVISQDSPNGCPDAVFVVDGQDTAMHLTLLLFGFSSGCIQGGCFLRDGKADEKTGAIADLTFRLDLPSIVLVMIVRLMGILQTHAVHLQGNAFGVRYIWKD
jgi:hypothetical protein